MITFFMLLIVWSFVLFFVSAEIYRRVKPVIAFIFSTLISGLICVLSILVWFNYEKDGFSQYFGAMYYSAYFGLTILVTALVFWKLSKKKA